MSNDATETTDAYTSSPVDVRQGRSGTQAHDGGSTAVLCAT